MRNRDYRSARGPAVIATRLTELLGIHHPIVLGGMSRATAADVVAAVSGAGGLEQWIGREGDLRRNLSEVRQSLQAARRATPSTALC